MNEIDLIDLDLKKYKELNEESITLPIKDNYKCPKCKYIFDKEDNIEIYEETGEVYSGQYFDKDYFEEKTYEVPYVVCPNCNFKDIQEDFPTAWTEDIEDAPNAEDLVPGVTDYINNLD